MVVTNKILTAATLFTSIFVTAVCQAAVLPEDRVDVLYHAYDGGGAEINGPSILMRKQFAETVSVWGNYYADMVTNASIDVETGGSTQGYSEDRTEFSLGVDYLYDKTTLSLSYTNSSENDYEAETVGFALSQDFFGDLTTLSLNYSQGNDTVMSNADNDLPTEEQLADPVNHQRYGIGLSQILTKNWIVSLNAESVIDEATPEFDTEYSALANPYRSAMFYDAATGSRLSQREKYPFTRNSDAFAIRSMYYLPYRAAVRLEYRVFSDSWGIEADNYELRYIHPIGDQWTIEAKYRNYSQTQANFYSDLFNERDEYTFMARDKELSTYTSTSMGIGGSYVIKARWLQFVDKASVNLFIDTMSFEYDNFRDARESMNLPGRPAVAAVGQESMYQFDATVIRLFISVLY